MSNDREFFRIVRSDGIDHDDSRLVVEFSEAVGIGDMAKAMVALEEARDSVHNGQKDREGFPLSTLAAQHD